MSTRQEKIVVLQIANPRPPDNHEYQVIHNNSIYMCLYRQLRWGKTYSADNIAGHYMWVFSGEMRKTLTVGFP